MGTDPTRPTPPPAPARRSPDVLAPVAASPAALIVSGGWQIEGLPAIVRRAGPQAAERTVEFFTAQIRNPHTRAAYGTAVTRFFTWCDAHGLEPGHRHHRVSAQWRHARARPGDRRA